MKATQTATILVVDDDDDVRRSVAETLEDEGYRVVTARNGQEALDLLRNCVPTPRLILLDMMMPVMDGRRFRAEQLKDLALAPIPVVLVTADARAAQEARELTTHSALEKPFQLSDLLKIAERFCGPPAAG